MSRGMKAAIALLVVGTMVILGLQYTYSWIQKSLEHQPEPFHLTVVDPGAAPLAGEGTETWARDYSELSRLLARQTARPVDILYEDALTTNAIRGDLIIGEDDRVRTAARALGSGVYCIATLAGSRSVSTNEAVTVTNAVPPIGVFVSDKTSAERIRFLLAILRTANRDEGLMAALRSEDGFEL